MPIDSVIHTNRYSIDRVLQAGLPVVLVFWRPDIPEMDRLDPVLERLAGRYAGKALIAKVNAAEEKPLMERFRVVQVPSFVFIKDGRADAVVPGVLGKSELEAWLRYLQGSGPRPAVREARPTPNGQAAQTRTSRGYRTRETAGARPRPQPRPTTAGSDGKPVVLTDATFEQVIRGDKPVLVDFWAPWCGPCRMIAPSIEQLAREYGDRAVIAKLNVDENPVTAQRYGVMSIPTLIIFRNGQPVDRIVGVQPLPALRQRLARFVS